MTMLSFRIALRQIERLDVLLAARFRLICGRGVSHQSTPCRYGRRTEKRMSFIGILAGVAMILLVLEEGFEVMVLPRRISRPYRLTVGFYRVGWGVWGALFGALAGREGAQVVL